MEIVIAFALVAVILVVPIMIGARVVNARNTGFGFALLAVVALSVISAAIDRFVGHSLVSVVVVALLGAAVLAAILGTTFLRGLAVSAIAAIIQVGAMLLIAGML